MPGIIVFLPTTLRDEMLSLLAAGQQEAVLCAFLRTRLQLSEAEIDAARNLPNWSRRVRLAPTIIRELQAIDSYSFQAERFSQLRPDVTLLLGGSSPPFRHQMTNTFLAGLPNARIVTLPGQGHGAIRSAPDLFSRSVIACLQAPERG